MTQAEVEELVEIMTVGAPEEQRYPAPRARLQASRRPPPGVSNKSRRGARARQRASTPTSIARPLACSGRSSGSAGSITRRGTRWRRSPSRRTLASFSALPSAVRCCSRTTACCRCDAGSRFAGSHRAGCAADLRDRHGLGAILRPRGASGRRLACAQDHDAERRPQARGRRRHDRCADPLERALRPDADRCRLEGPGR